MKKTSLKWIRSSVKIVSIFLSFVLLITFVTSSIHVSAETLALAAQTEYAIRSNTAIKLCDNLQKEIKEKNIYENEYAGAYMNTDGSITVFSTSPQAIKEYRTICNQNEISKAIVDSRQLVKNFGYTIGTGAAISTDSILHYELAKYSYEILKSVYELILSSSLQFDVSEVRISDRDNSVIAYTRNDTLRDEIITYIEEAGYSSDILEFCHTEREIELAGATINACNAISGGTVGFAARYNGQYGFVTAGHVVGGTGVGTWITSTDGVSLFSTSSFYHNSGTTDVAFFPTPFGCSNISSSISYGGTIRSVTGTTSVYQGQSITGYGQVSGRCYGSVTNSHVGYTSSTTGFTYSDFFSTSTTFKKGDSGGPIITSSGNLIGIIHSTSGYGCKYTNINNAGIAFVANCS